MGERKPSVGTALINTTITNSETSGIKKKKDLILSIYITLENLALELIYKNLLYHYIPTILVIFHMWLVNATGK